jgi:hypothetical protein
MVARDACAPALPSAGSQGYAARTPPRPRHGNSPATVYPPDLATGCVATRKSWHKQGGFAMRMVAARSNGRGLGSATVGRASATSSKSGVGSARLTILAATAGATIALCGCATTQPTRYVSVYCVPPETQLPAEPPKVHDQLTGHADKDAGILAGSTIRLRAWGQALNHILEGCREPTH